MRSNLGMEIAPYHNGNVMRLDDLLYGLVPERSKMSLKRHSAGGDACFHVYIYRALVAWVHAARPEGLTTMAKQDVTQFMEGGEGSL